MIHPAYSPHTLRNFIVIEGIDGAGTSTQSLLLERAFQSLGLPARLSCEPTPGPIGTLIKQIMRGRLTFSEDRAVTERQLAYLFAADRHDHLYNEVDGIVQQIRKGYIAISTRYFFSSYAYNARSREGVELVDRLNRDFPLPQVIVYLRCDPKVALERLEVRDVREFYEREEELLRVARNFELLFEPLRERVITVEASQSMEKNAEIISEEVSRRLKNNED